MRILRRVRQGGFPRSAHIGTSARYARNDARLGLRRGRADQTGVFRALVWNCGDTERKSFAAMTCTAAFGVHPSRCTVSAVSRHAERAVVAASVLGQLRLDREYDAR